MPIFKKPNLDDQCDFSKANPLLDFRFVYKNNKSVVENSIESSIKKLKLDKEAYEAVLETEKDFAERDRLKEKIEKIDKEIEELEPIKESKMPSNILYGLESNVKEIEEKIEEEGDIQKRQLLESTRLSCLDALAERQKAIKDQMDLENALDQVNSDNYILEALEKGSFDHLHIEYLLSSDLKPFFDIDFQTQLSEAEEQMIIKDNVRNALGPNREELLQTADEDWFEYKDKTLKESNKLSSEEENIQAELKKKDLDANKKRAKKLRLKWLDRFIPYTSKQAEERGDWVHKQVLNKENKVARVNLLKNVPPKVINKLKNLIREARSMRMERMHEYIDSKFKKAKKRFEKIKKAGVFGKSTIEGEILVIDGKKIERRGLQTDFDECEVMLQFLEDPTDTNLLKKITRQKNITDSEYTEKFQDPEMLKKLAKNLDELDRRTDVSIEEIQKVNENRPEIEKAVLEGFESMNDLLSQIKPEELARLKEELEKSETARIEALKNGETKDAKTKYDEVRGDSLIYKRKLNAIDELANPESDLHKKFKKYQELLQDIGSLEPEELAAIQNDLEMLSPKLELVRNLNENIDKALEPENNLLIETNKAIIEIEGAIDAEEINDIIKRNLGSEHLELVSHSEFNRKWKKHASKKGFMVFVKKGDKWRIVVDKSKIKGKENLSEFKKQLIHEILHVQFENSEDLRNTFYDQMVEKNQEWPKIKSAFKNWMKEEGRKTPKGGYTDEYILSELYAMQNEIGNVHKRGKGPKAELNNLLAGIGVKDMVKDIEGKTKKFEDEKEEVLGYAGGNIDETQAALGGEAEESSGSYDEYKIKIDFIDERTKDLQKNEFLGYVTGGPALLRAIKGFNNHTKKLNDDFKKHPDNGMLGAGVGGRIKSAEDELANIERAIGEVSSNAPNLEINPLRKLWNSSTFLSAQDIIQAMIDAKEFIERRHNRKKQDHAARLGMAVFQGTALGREAYARQQKAEMEEVQEWQSRYENLDAWELESEVKVVARDIDPSPDRLKAILRLLAQKGRIDWRNEYLWKALNKMQNSVHLTPGDAVLLHDPPLMRKKLHVALGEIFDYDEFLTLERQNESSYDGELRKYLPSYDRIQDLLNDRLDQLLRMYRNGEKVDPMEYESIMVYSIEKGKAFAENVMFHLMVGMADGLLTQDRGMALDKYLNNWPATQWIYSKKPPLSKSDYQRYCKQYFKKDYERGSITADGCGADFMNFYWVHVQNDPMTIQRVRKSVSERQWDHDWTRSIACLGDANTAKRFFSGKSGQQETKDTGVENAYAGAVQWIEENARKPEKIDFRKHFARHAAWCAMAEGIMDRVAYYRGDTDISTRANENMERQISREQGSTNHADWTMRDNRNKIKSFLDYLDPDLFAILRHKKDLREKEDKETVGLEVKNLLLSKYPSRADEWETIQHVDDVYEKMDLIIQTIFESLSDGRLKEIIKEMRA